MVRLNVNGSERAVAAPSGQSLLDLLRDDLRLTGTKYGCGGGQCGACTVLVDGAPVRACVVDVDKVDGRSVTTVEGLASERHLHAAQTAFIEARSLQCGYCTPAMVMSAVALLARDPMPDDSAIRGALAGNICRCGGYPTILQAVHLAAAALQSDARPQLADEAPTMAPTRGSEASGGLWTLVLRPTGDDTGDSRGWGWSTPGGARLTIDSTGLITAFTGKVDGGQGNRTALTRLVAAELATSTSAVRLEMGDTSCVPFDLGTFGSRSVPDAGHALRLLATEARRELVRAAAEQWEVEPEDLVPVNAAVHTRRGDRQIAYATLVGDAERMIVVDAEGRLASSPPDLGAVDAAALQHQLVAAVTGAKRFPSDLAIPGMLHGRVLRPPAYGAVLRTVDTSAAQRMPGVTVVEDGDFVAVAAETRAAATAALHALRADWQESTIEPSESDLEDYLRSHPVETAGWDSAVRIDCGDVDAAVANAEVRLAATYTTAYIAHVPLEPRVAVARLDADTATVWVGTQRPFAVRWEVAAALGLDEDHVRIIVPDFGGGFGGKHTGDVAVEAARLARATGHPVKVAWTRAEEFCWAYFRPASVIDVRSSATRSGDLTSWEFVDINAGSAGLISPYDVPNQQVRFQPAQSPLPQGSYRALAATANHFARESHIDELALALQVDPVDLRLRHLSDTRLADVIAAVTDNVDWRHQPSEAGRGYGLACGVEKDARVATVADVVVGTNGDLRVLRLVTAFDCGAVVDPDGLRNQITGATIMGLGGALFETIHFDAGRITNASLAEYRVPRFTDVPAIDVIVLDRPAIPSAGAGETPIIAIAPAIANAICAATGRRLRALPLAPDGLVH